MLGTPAYMSPEQVSGQMAKIGPASDVYGLGRDLLRDAGGTTSFRWNAGTHSGTNRKLRPAPPSLFNQRIDPKLEAICLRAMARSTDDRFASASEFAEALEDYSRSIADGQSSTTALGGTVGDLAASRELAAPVDQVRQLWKEERFAEIIPILEELLARREPAAEEHAQWARQQLPVVRRQRERQVAAARRAEEMPWRNSAPTLPAAPLWAASAEKDEDRTPKWVLWLLPVPALVFVFLILMLLVNGLGSARNSTVAGAYTLPEADLSATAAQAPVANKENSNDQQDAENESSTSAADDSTDRPTLFRARF